ncbi:MAG: hypothetical protein U0V75_11160 [Ferruginibacter sp.]
MKKNIRTALLLLLGATVFSSCMKEYSDENNGDADGIIIGTDCRISKIAYADSATGSGLGSLSAVITSLDEVTDITKFDSLSLTIDFNSLPQYFSDTVYIDPDQYYVRETGTKRIKLFHGLVDPTVPGSAEYEVDYVYDGNGRLSQKLYRDYPSTPGIYYQKVTYTYSGGNLVSMVSTDEFTGTLIKDAELTFYTNIAPRNFMYLFPDENSFAEFNQFFNFGTKSANAVKSLKVRYYAAGVPFDSTVSVFKGYVMSRDNYVLSTYMLGDDQSSIPAPEGRLKFSYHCK